MRQLGYPLIGVGFGLGIDLHADHVTLSLIACALFFVGITSVIWYSAPAPR